MIEHQFALENATVDPIRLTGAMAMKTCCSNVGDLPEEIPAGGSASIPIQFRPGQQAGKRRVEFLVMAEAGGVSLVYELALHVNLLPDLQVLEDANQSLVTYEGRSATERLDVLFRHRDDSGLAAPSSVEAIAPLSAAFVGEPRETPEQDGVTAVRKTIEVALPASGSTGFHAGTLVFHWPDGSEREIELSWRVRSSVEVQPSTLILDRRDRPGRKAITIVSRDGSFRIVGVDNPFSPEPVDLPEGAAASHSVSLVLDAATPREGDEVITIETDHPDHPILTVGVFDLAGVNEEGHDEAR